MGRGSHCGIIYKSASMKRLMELVDIISGKDIRVLIQGERGTGKELIARAIHKMSERKDRPLTTLNCAVLSRDLLISELFGHVKGSFTGATSTRVGLLMSADGGTLFLDEVGDLSLEAQAAILRFLQEGEVRPIGSLQTLKVNVRVISATNKNLREEIRKGNFREDLYDRLNGFTLKVPPLRERREDIPPLIDHFISKYNERYHEDVKGVTKEAQDLLLKLPFPGNVRELENIISSTVLLSQGKSRIGLKELLEVLPLETLLNLSIPKEYLILKYILDKGEVRPKEVSSIFHLNEKTTRLYLKRMVKGGIIKSEGTRRSIRYFIKN